MAKAYVTNQGSNNVSVIDTVSDTVTATVTVGTQPIGSAVTPDGSKAYITNYNNGGAGSVSVVNTATNAIIKTITVGTRPFGIAITPDGTTAYVGNSGSSTVSVIDTASNTVTATIGIGGDGVAITPDGLGVYVPSSSTTVSLINTATNAVTNTITVGSNPYDIAISLDGGTAYVTNSGTNTVSLVNTATNLASTSIVVGTSPQGLAMSPNGLQLYVANTSSNSISVIKTATNTVSSTIAVGSQPVGLCFTPDGSKAYVGNVGSSAVSVIDTATATVISTITVGNSPYGFGQFIVPPTPPVIFVTPPQGRLTLSSSAAVMTADVTGATTIYYLPYRGASVPVYNGALFISKLMTSAGLSLALDSNSGHTGYQASGSLFDLFAFVNNGVLTLGTGPAWTNGTTRANAITQLNGVWVNTAAITIRFGSASGNTVSVTANQATYLGTMYATANGQTGMALKPAAASGGSANIIGLWNAYNRESVTALCRDSSVSWTYGTNTWRAANLANGGGNNFNNSIHWVDGLQQSSVSASYFVNMQVTTAGKGVAIAVNLDSQSATPNIYGFLNVSGTLELSTMPASESFYPQMGYHYIQAMENAPDSVGVIFYGSGVLQGLTITLDM